MVFHILLYQEERLKRLKHRMKIYFDASRLDHQVSYGYLWQKLTLEMTMDDASPLMVLLVCVCVQNFTHKYQRWSRKLQVSVHLKLIHK